MTLYAYRSSGLRLAASCPLPGLLDDRSGGTPDLTLDLGANSLDRCDAPTGAAWRAHPVRDERGRPLLEIRRSASGAWYRLAYPDGTRFAVDRRARRIRAAWPDDLTLEDAVSYLVGPVLGFALRLRGTASLHASAVAFDGAAVAFLGSAGAGKSTLAAGLTRAGHALVCDDAAALASDGHGIAVQPGCPRIRLWPDSAAMLTGSSEGLPRLTPTWDKRVLDLSQSPQHLCREALPLAAVYVLGARVDGAARIEPLSQREALVCLLSHSYMGCFQDARMRAREFALFARLCATLPVRRLRVPLGARALPALRDAIADDLRAPHTANLASGGRR